MALKFVDAPIKLCFRHHERILPPIQKLIQVQIAAGFHPLKHGYPFNVRHKLRDNGMSIKFCVLPDLSK